jgi:hypothetical protein
MTIQSKFDLTINLLKANSNSFPIVKGLIDIYSSSEMEFFCFDEASRTSPGTTKDNILGAYEIRARIHSESKDSPLILGYDMLLPNLRVTKHDHICVSNLLSNIGGFLIFSDFDRQDLIGLLCTKNTLVDRRNWRAEYKRKADSGEILPQYNYEEVLFVNGNYAKNS